MNSPSTLAARTLTLQRRLPGTPQACFEAWTRHLPEWWGPHGTTVPFWEMDLRPGGILRTRMRTADGSEYATSGVFLEVVPHRKLVLTDAYGPDWEPMPGLFFTAITTFSACADGSTEYEARAVHWTEEAARQHEAMGFYQGWGESAERFAAVVARLQAAAK